MTKPAAPRASVIIPVFRHWDHVRICLDALARQSLAQDAFEIVLVNNDPSVPPPGDLRLPPNARIVEEPRKGSYAARNAGVRAARAPILCFTDADCVPEPGWLNAAVEILQADAGPLRLGGPIRLLFGHDRLSAAETYQSLTSFNQRRYIGQGGWSATANMCTHAASFDKVGPFNAALYSGGDREWGTRAQAAGVPIRFVDDLVVGHPARTSMRDLIRKERRITGGKVMRKLEKHPRWRRRASYVVTLPLKVLPFSSAIRKLLAREDVPLGQRLRAAGVLYLLKLSRLAETGRILLLNGEPERR